MTASQSQSSQAFWVLEKRQVVRVMRLFCLCLSYSINGTAGGFVLRGQQFQLGTSMVFLHFFPACCLSVFLCLSHAFAK